MSMTISSRLAHARGNKSNGQRRHDLRSGYIPAYVDKNRIDQNSVIIEPKTAGELREICEARREIKGFKRKMPKDAVIGVNGIITFGTEAQNVIEAMTPAQQDALFLKAAKKLTEEMGTDLTGLVVHRDESAIHAHYQAPGYRLDGDQVQKHTNTTMLKRMQDLAADVFGHLGITRGKPKAERIRLGEDASKFINRSVQQLHNDLPREIQEIEAKRDKNQRLLDETLSKLADGTGDVEKLEKRAKVYEKRLNDAQGALERLEQVHPKPEPHILEVVDKREKRFLREDKVNLKKTKVISNVEFDHWAHSVAAEIERNEKRAIDAEQRAEQAEKRLKQTSELNEALTEEIIKLRPADEVSMTDAKTPQNVAQDDESQNQWYQSKLMR